MDAEVVPLGRFFRVNTGRFWAGRYIPVKAGDIVTIQHGDVLLRGARTVMSGCEGMPDWNGWHSMTITPDDVGKTVAVYVAIEGKTPDGRLTEAQEKHLGIVRKAGGIAFVVRSPDDTPPDF